MLYSELRFTSGDGRLTLYARDYGGEGRSLLLMHGLTRNSADFEALAAALAGKYRLIVPDQRGRGLSEHDPDPAFYRPDVYAADMFALLAALLVERPSVVGTSMGGLIALVMNALRPGCFATAAFNDVGPVLSPEGLRRIGNYVGSTVSFADLDEAAEVCAAINRHAFPEYGPEDWRAWAQRTCREGPDKRLAFDYDPAIAQGFTDPGEKPDANLWPLWGLLGETPVLAIRGAHSDLLSPETLAEMERRHAGPFASVTVPGRGHAPMLDEPEAIAGLRAFLEEHQS
ncbi:MAG: alpha/beta hydrolase [Alteraurantiacibacter sp.]